ncbi:MAG: hypothetical protein R3B48_14385 [Kofleriaceae bacterium]
MACVLLSACLSSEDPQDPPAPPPPGPDPVTVTVTINVHGTAALVAFRDGPQAPWANATKVADAGYEAKVRGPYVVSVTCPVGFDGATPDTSQYALTVDDPHVLEVYCTKPPQDTFSVTGSLVHASFVGMGNLAQAFPLESRDFSFTVAPGTYDLIAADGERAVIRRGVAVSDNVALPAPIDVTSEGVELVSRPFTVTNAGAGENVRGAVRWRTPHNDIDALVWEGDPQRAMIPPATLLGDQEEVILEAQGTVFALPVVEFRSTRRGWSDGASMELALPDPYTGLEVAVSGDSLTASWTARQAFDENRLIAFSETAGLSLMASSKYLSATDATSLAIDTNIPGFLEAWKVDFAGAYSYVVAARHRSETGRHEYSRTKFAEPATLR